MDEQSIFLKALEQPSAADRSAYLAQVCGENTPLRQRIQSLLDQHDDLGSFLEKPPVELEATRITPGDTQEESRAPGIESKAGRGPDQSLAFLTPSSVPGCLGTLGQYEVRSILGQGGMGLVLKAFDTKLHRIVAVKVLAPEIAANAAARQRFLREARAAAAVTHPHVVTIHAVEEGTAGGAHIPYLVMECVDGKTLRDKLDAVGTLGVREVLRIGSQIAHGLAAAHKQGLIHRDIKPANILLENGVERVKITDFGLARAVDDLSVTRTGDVAGTPQYMSPEQAQGQAVDQRSDLFSLGSVLYTMCTGRSPFRGEGVMAVLRRVVDDTPRPIREVNPDVPQWLCDIVATLHAKQPQDRYQTAAEVAALLEQALAEVQHASTSVTRTSSELVGAAPAVTSQATAGRSRRWIAAGLFATLAALAGIIIKITTRESGTTTITVPADANVEETIEGGTVLAPVPTPTGWQGWPADAPPPALMPVDATTAQRHQAAWATYLQVPVEFTNSIGMRFRLIPPGEFDRGSTPLEVEPFRALHPEDVNYQSTLNQETPRHRVILTQPFYVSIYETTQEDYSRVTGMNPSHHCATGEGASVVSGLDTTRFPVERVSWNDAAGFCEALSGRENLSPRYAKVGELAQPLPEGNGYSLPTEAQWEFACRSGGMRNYCHSDDLAALQRLAWYDQNAEHRTHAVGELDSNAFGLCDMLGNVLEWCHDGFEARLYDRYAAEGAVDPVVSPDNNVSLLRKTRGGNFKFDPAYLRCGLRSHNYSTMMALGYGFRVAVSVDGAKQILQAGRAARAEVSATWHGWPADAPAPAIAPFDAVQARTHQVTWAEYLGVPVEYENSLGMRFVLIPPGEFTMGSTQEDIEETLKQVDPNDTHWQECIKSQAPQHKVILTQPIYLSVNEVTQAEYEKVMGVNPSHFAVTGSGKEAVAGLETTGHPVETVSWNDAAEFCAKLSQHEKLKPFYFRAGETITPLDGTGYRLPSEAEWEFGCRAGTATKYWIGDEDEDLHMAGWFAGNSGGRTHAVGALKVNPFGLFDIHGNVWEWVQDGWDATYYEESKEKPAIDPKRIPLSSGSEHMLRGGYWNGPASPCRSSNRAAADQSYRLNFIGFRVALSVDAARAVATSDVSPANPTSAWDLLDSADIPASERCDDQPPELVAVAGEQRQHHWASVISVAIRPDGKQAASCSFDGVRLWNLETFEQTAHLHRVSMPDLTSSGYYTVLYESDSHTLLIGHSTDFGPEMATIITAVDVTAASPRVTRSWKLDRQQFGHSVPQLLEISASGRFLAWKELGGGRGFVTERTEAGLRLLREFADTRRLSFSPDETLVAHSKLSVGPIGFYRLNQGEVLETGMLEGVAAGPADGAIAPLRDARFSPDGRLLVIGKDDSAWLYAIDSEMPRPLYQLPSKTWHPSFSRNGGKLLASYSDSGDSMDVWDVGDSQAVFRSLPLAPSVSGNVASMSISDNGSLVMSGHINGTVRFWDCAAMPPKELHPPLPSINGLRVIDQLHTLGPAEFATSSGDPRVVNLLSVKEGRLQLATITGQNDRLVLCVSPDGILQVQWESAPDRVVLLQRDGNQWKTIRQLPTQLQDVTVGKFSPDGNRLFLGTSRGEIECLNLSGNRPVRLWSARVADRDQLFRMDCVAGGAALVAQYHDTIEYLPLTESGVGEKFTLVDHAAWKSMDVSADGQSVAVTQVGRATIWSIADKTPREQQSLSLPIGHECRACSLAPDNRKFATALGDGEILLFDLETGLETRRLRLPGLVTQIAFTSDSRHLVTANGNGTVYVLRLTDATGQPYSPPPAAADVTTSQPADDSSSTTGWHGWPADAPAPAIAPFDEVQARAHQEAWAQYLGVPVVYENSLGMKFRLIPPGEFLMGSTEEEIAAELQAADPIDPYTRQHLESEGPRRRVVLTQPFFIGVTEVTQSQYQRVTGANPSKFQRGAAELPEFEARDTSDYPVDNLSWNEAAEFCASLSHLEQRRPRYFRNGQNVSVLAGDGYRLPTDAEWEFFARAGTTSRYWVGDSHQSYADAEWTGDNSGLQPHPVGQLKANPFGLHDVLGNVAEPVEDQWHLADGADREVTAVDPLGGNGDGRHRVVRGQSARRNAEKCYCAVRIGIPAQVSTDLLGLRIALPVAAVKAAGGAQ